MARTANPNRPKRGFLDGYRTYDTSEGYGNPAQWRAAFRFRLGLDASREAVGNESPRDILCVSLSATWDEIVRAYRKLVKNVHPDLNPDKSADAHDFRRVQGAYEILEAEFGRR